MAELDPTLQRAGRGLRHRHRVLGLAGPARRRSPAETDRRRAGRARRRRVARRRRPRRRWPSTQRRPWTRMLPPLPGPPGAPDRRRSGCTSRTATRSRSGSSWRPAARRGQLRQLENWTPPREIDGGWVGEATLRDPRRPAAGLSHAARPVRRRATASMPLIITPAWLGLPGPDGRAPGLGAGHPALQRPLARSPGGSATSPTWRTWPSGRRPSTAPTTCWSTRCTPPSRCRRWSRRPTCRPPAASPTRSTCGWSGSRSTPLLDAEAARPRSTSCRVELKVRLARVDRDRPGPVLDGQAQGAARSSSRCRGRRAGRRRFAGVPRAARAGACSDFATWAALAEEHGPRFARLAGGAAGTRARRRSRPSRAEHADRGRLPLLAAVAAGRAARRRPSRPGRGPGWRSGVMHDLAVGVHPARGGRLGPAGHATPQGITVGAPPDPYNQNGQDWSQPPWRPDRLAETAYAPFRRDGLDRPAARRRHPGRPRDRAVPAVVDPGRAPARPRAPTSATTTRR